MYEPIVSLGDALVDHEMDVGGSVIIETRVDCVHLDHAFLVTEPTTTKPGLRGLESFVTVSTVRASRVRL